MASRIWDSASKAVFGSRSGNGGSGENVSSSSITQTSNPPSSSTSASYFDVSSYFDSSAYWNYASDSLNYATQSTYLTMASMLSSLYSASGDSPSIFGRSSGTTLQGGGADVTDVQRRGSSSFLLRMANRRYTTTVASSSPTDDVNPPPNHHSPFTMPRVSWGALTKNPYNIVRGRQPIDHKRQSISAVRSFLALVPVDEDEELDPPPAARDPRGTAYQLGADDAADPLLGSPWDRSRVRSFTTESNHAPSHNRSRDELASQVAEGTLRALRDLALEEALELNAALRFWSHRWERPLLSWLEAGPGQWWSVTGYRHRMVGERVAQLQAVLARRCAAIGELQQHLLRAGWQQGVAQWGVLDQFQTVSGVDGSIKNSPTTATTSHLPPFDNIDRSRVPLQVPPPPPPPLPPPVPLASQASGSSAEEPSSQHSHRSSRCFRRQSSHVGSGAADAAPRQQPAAHVLVRRGDGEGLYTDHPGFVAEWAVEAIALVRSHLFRAANGLVDLPYEENWVADGEDDTKAWPVWVSRVQQAGNTSDDEHPNPLKVTDLNLMMTEVTELLDVMEEIMVLQRQRRLDRMKPPGWLRRNWYVSATVGPATLWLLWTGSIQSIVSNTFARIRTFVHERFIVRFMAIVNEVLKGRRNFSDLKARQHTTQALKEMIRSWLDEMYPKMTEVERIAMSEAMDMSLVERKKAESMKTFFEINNVIRVSFIEMQYMKREMMNALAAMDNVISANDINMNLAAITPVIVLVYVNTRLFGFLYHAVLRLGRSREETYANFRSILTDIERLLVMRDSPPDISRLHQPPTTGEGDNGGIMAAICVLSPDDLGLVMVLIHELRTILMRERQRFTRDVIRGVSEDLAELAGERGAVSVRQQLQILTRMNRNYSFLKVQGTGTIFQYSLLR